MFKTAQALLLHKSKNRDLRSRTLLTIYIIDLQFAILMFKLKNGNGRTIH